MKKVIFVALGVFLLAACGNNNKEAQSVPDEDALIDSINTIEQATGNLGGLFSADTAEMLVNLYSRYVENFPDKDLTPIYMMRAADIEINRGNLERGIVIFDSVLAKYTPEGFDGYAACMLRKAEALDQDGEQGERAIAAYRDFMEEFPDHPVTKDLSKRFKYSTMSQDELREAVHKMEGEK